MHHYVGFTNCSSKKTAILKSFQSNNTLQIQPTQVMQTVGLQQNAGNLLFIVATFFESQLWACDELIVLTCLLLTVFRTSGF